MDNKQFYRNIRSVFGALFSLATAGLMMFGGMQPASIKELSVGLLLTFAWLFANEYKPN